MAKDMFKQAKAKQRMAKKNNDAKAKAVVKQPAMAVLKKPAKAMAKKRGKQ